MNQRIKELAEQAGYKHPDAVGMSEDYAYFSHEKFAELIVRECALVATRQFTGYIYPVDVASYVTAGKVQSARMIKQHFGIE